MLLTVDIGNTNITLGVFDGEQLCFTARLSTDLLRTSDQYAVELMSCFLLNSADCRALGGAIISSVVPGLTACISDAVEKISGIKPMQVTPGVKTGLNIRIDNPAQLGADLVAVSVAALAYYPCPNVVCDLGTASTISVLGRDGSMLGGIIYPGIRTSLSALVGNTSLLHSVSFDAPARVIGRNTTECMQSGVVYGAAALLDGMLMRVERELGEPVTAIATGGLSRSIIEHCERSFIYNEHLVLEGLRIIFDKNR